jgi:non-ribosomal peptide synthetase-like protein
VAYRRVGPARCGTLRRAVFGTVQLVNLLLLAPLVLATMLLLAKQVDVVVRLLGPGPLVVTDGTFFLQQLAFTSVVFFGGAILGLGVVVTVPRLLVRAVHPGRVYPLYGVHYWLHRAVSRLTNASFYVNLFGDSSYILGYLRAVGYRIGPGGNTGSNFGAAQKHETPYLCSIGTGTVISDGISFVNAEYSSTSFRTSEVVIGAGNFFGNGVTYPAGGRIGNGCLVATKAMIPLDGPLRDDVGLIGSPCFEMPRSRPDSRFDLSRAEFRRRLAAKNRHNIATMALFLAVGWLWLLAALVIACAALDLYARFGAVAIAVGMVVEVGVSFGYAVLVERVVTRFRAMRPRYCSIYDPYFWWHERFWKLSTQPVILNGTPFKALTWRLLGARIGRRVFDDGCTMTEKSLVSVGDRCTLNGGTVLQAHSMEDGIFKSDHIVLGDRVTLAPGAFVHYGTRVGDGATLHTDTFLMKGEEVPAGAHWTGNPAHDVRAESHQRRSSRGDLAMGDE